MQKLTFVFLHCDTNARHRSVHSQPARQSEGKRSAPQRRHPFLCSSACSRGKPRADSDNFTRLLILRQTHGVLSELQSLLPLTYSQPFVLIPVSRLFCQRASFRVLYHGAC